MMYQPKHGDAFEVDDNLLKKIDREMEISRTYKEMADELEKYKPQYPYCDGDTYVDRFGRMFLNVCNSRIELFEMENLDAYREDFDQHRMWVSIEGKNEIGYPLLPAGIRWVRRAGYAWVDRCACLGDMTEHVIGDMHYRREMCLEWENGEGKKCYEYKKIAREALDRARKLSEKTDPDGKIFWNQFDAYLRDTTDLIFEKVSPEEFDNLTKDEEQD